MNRSRDVRDGADGQLYGTLFGTIGKKCKQTHFYQLVPSPVGLTLREVEFERKDNVKLMYFDEATEIDESVITAVKTKRKAKKGGH